MRTRGNLECLTDCHRVPLVFLVVTNLVFISVPFKALEEKNDVLKLVCMN